MLLDITWWQKTLMPVKYFCTQAELYNDCTWSTVPLEILPLIEEEFQKNPFNSVCKLGEDSAKFCHFENETMKLAFY